MECDRDIKEQEDAAFALGGQSSLAATSAVVKQEPSSGSSSGASVRIKSEADEEEPAQASRSARGTRGARGAGPPKAGPPSPDAADCSRSSSASEEVLPGRGEMVGVEAEAVAEALELDEPAKERPTRLRRTVTARQPALGALGAPSEDSYDDYSSSEEEEMRKTIMIGSAYQAVVPEGFAKYGPGDARPYKHADKLLWEPGAAGAASAANAVDDDDALEHYLQSAQGVADGEADGVGVLPMGAHTRDDEQALFLLMQCGHDADEALRKRRANPPPPPATTSSWTEEECRNFESGILTYGKDFHTIQAQRLRTRTVSEIVQFYYLWKKTERHDVFAAKMRPDKKKYMLHPGVTLVVYELLDKENQKEAVSKDAVAASSF